MSNDNWMEETIPGRRVKPEYGETEGHVPSGLNDVSAYEERRRLTED